MMRQLFGASSGKGDWWARQTRPQRGRRCDVESIGTTVEVRIGFSRVSFEPFTLLCCGFMATLKLGVDGRVERFVTPFPSPGLSSSATRALLMPF
jgi:hypothetical protein